MEYGTGEALMDEWRRGDVSGRKKTTPLSENDTGGLST